MQDKSAQAKRQPRNQDGTFRDTNKTNTPDTDTLRQYADNQSDSRQRILPTAIQNCLNNGPEDKTQGWQRMERLQTALTDEAWTQRDRRQLAYGDPCYVVDDGVYLDENTFDALPVLEQNRYRAWACGADPSTISEDDWNDENAMDRIALNAYEHDDDGFYYTDADPMYLENDCDVDISEYVYDTHGGNATAFGEAFDTAVHHHPNVNTAWDKEAELPAVTGPSGRRAVFRRLDDGSYELSKRDEHGRQVGETEYVPVQSEPVHHLNEYNTAYDLLHRAVDWVDSPVKR